jgi:hypothetical protein
MAIARELEVWNSLQAADSYLLIVKVNKAGGSHYVEKNLWTTFGAMPFYVMGGVISSFSLLEGKTGDLIASGAIPIHSGYKSAKEAGNGLD